MDGINNNVLSIVNDTIDKINKDKDKDAKPSDIKIGSTFGIGDFIVLGENAGKNKYGKFDDTVYENDVKHEYGHTKQYDNMGPVKFIKDIAIPSMKGYTEDMDEEEYYSQPWEKGADELGGTKRNFDYLEGSYSIGTEPDDKSLYGKSKQFFQKLVDWLDRLN